MRLKIAAAALFVMFATPASAETCEALLLKVDKAIEEAQASSETKDQAMRLRDEGERQRADGGDCPALRQALQLLGE